MKKKLLLLATFTFVMTLLLTGCDNKKTTFIENDDNVSFIYDSYLLDGEIIEEGIEETITIGQQDKFKIFDTELLGLKSGEEKTFKTQDPMEGYGIYHRDTKIQEIATAIFNNIGISPSIGEEINLGELNGVIMEIYPTTIKIDFNEKKTRENVEFKVKITSIEKTTVEK